MTEKHWHGFVDGGGIHWLSLDVAGSSTNTLSRDVLNELGAVVGRLEANPPKGLIIRSAKPNGFIAGADVSEFADIATSAEAIDYIRWVHSIFERI